MKKFSFLLAIVSVFSLSLFNSCTEEEADDINIVITELEGATYTSGSHVDYSVLISSNEELESLMISPSSASNPASEIVSTVPADALDLTDMTFENNLTTVTIVYRYYVPTTVSAGSTISVEFEVTDDATTTSASIDFDVVNEFTAFTAVLMGAQNNTSTGSFLDVNTGTVYLKADADNNTDKIDLVYYFGSTNEATLCAPSDETVGGGAANLALCEGWATKNATSFAASTLSFDDLTAADLNDVTVSNSKETKLAVNDVVVFETVDGKKGALKVTNIEDTNTGAITIEVKILN